MVKQRSLMSSFYVPTIFFAIGQGFMVPVLPLFAASFGVSLVLVSLAVASAHISQLLSDIPLGLVTDRVGRRRLMILGLIFISSSYVAMIFSQTIWDLILYGLLFGLGVSMWRISRHVSIIELTATSGRGTTMSVLGGLERLGSLVGPILGGFLVAFYGFRSPFGIFAGLAAGAILFVLVDGTANSKHVQPKKNTVFGSDLLSVLKLDRRKIGVSCSTAFLTTVVRQGRLILIPLFGSFVLKLPIEQIGVIITISTIMDFVMFAPAGYIMDNLGRKFAIVPAFIIMGIGLAIIPFTNSFLSLLAACLVIGLGNGLGTGTMMTLAADLAPKKSPGGFIGLWRTISDIAAFVGTLFVGLLANQFGFLYSALILAIISIISSAFFGLFYDERLQKSN